MPERNANPDYQKKQARKCKISMWLIEKNKDKPKEFL